MPALRASLVILALGCVYTHPEGEPGPPLRGIDFRAELAVLEPSPVRLAPTVTIRNRRATAATLTFPLACLGLLRAYEAGLAAPVWEQTPGERCQPDALSLSLDPGEERRVPILDVGAKEILGEGLADGTYRFTVLLVPDGHVLEVQAGEVELARSRT